jgi:hypothetical protein
MLCAPHHSPLAAFGTVDWVILGAYLATMLVIGLVAAWRESRHKSGTAEFFLGGRSMPTWALAISIVGSSLSVATFVGVPDTAYAGNLTYLILFVGNFAAVFLVGFVFVPRLYNAGTVTIYGYLAGRFGEGARVARQRHVPVRPDARVGRAADARGGAAVHAGLNVPAGQVTRQQIGLRDPRHRLRRHVLHRVRRHPHGRVGGHDPVRPRRRRRALTIGLLLHRIPMPRGGRLDAPRRGQAEGGGPERSTCKSPTPSGRR